ncbi:hypothetical protein MAMC_01848 [Methylacidimicrobium cyclopophantes]|uniref:VanZ-like domain-containing protein n=1 Tax=Methylacidimicrobium cyclopophantes TaxID=1041766 RepID=A0A5E6MFQ0_9BACT|nr:hypothetical protein MAMC_01848 [Methylacidimicrobium cyclopophantes]
MGFLANKSVEPMNPPARQSEASPKRDSPSSHPEASGQGDVHVASAPPRRSGKRIFRWIAFFAYALLLLSLSSIPGSKLPREVGLVNDKLLHGTAYSGAGMLARMATGATPLATAAVALLGAVDENYQRWIPGRTPDPRDWVADLFGGFLGALLTGFWMRLRSGRERRPPSPAGRLGSLPSASSAPSARHFPASNSSSLLGSVPPGEGPAWRPPPPPGAASRRPGCPLLRASRG